MLQILSRSVNTVCHNVPFMLFYEVTRSITIVVDGFNYNSSCEDVSTSIFTSGLSFTKKQQQYLH